MKMTAVVKWLPEETKLLTEDRVARLVEPTPRMVIVIRSFICSIREKLLYTYPSVLLTVVLKRGRRVLLVCIRNISLKSDVVYLSEAPSWELPSIPPPREICYRFLPTRLPSNYFLPRYPTPWNSILDTQYSILSAVISMTSCSKSQFQVTWQFIVQV